MRRKLLSILVLVSLVLAMVVTVLPSGTVLAAPSQKESHDGASKTEMSSYGTNFYSVHAFTATSSYVLDSIRPLIKRTGDPGMYTIDLYYANHLGLPVGWRDSAPASPLPTPLSTGSGNGTALSTSLTYDAVTMAPFYITQGEQYVYVIKAPDGDSSNKVIVNTTDAVKSGSFSYYTTGNGNSWFKLPTGPRYIRHQIWGEVLDTYPTVSTSIPSGLTSSAATFGGNLVSMGSGATDVDVYFEWDFSERWDDHDQFSTPVDNVSSTGTFGDTVDLPVGGRPYQVRAVATNDLGNTAYGITRTFNAPAFPITIFNDSRVHRGGEITHTFQRKAFYAAGRHWIFAYFQPPTGGIDRGFYFSSSTDGLAWEPWALWYDVDTRVTANEADEFGTFFDGTYIHMTYVLNRWFESPTTNNLMYRRGLPNTDGTITWSAAWQVVEAQDDGVKGYPSIAVDDSGHAYIAHWKTATHSGEMESGTKSVWVHRNDNTDGTWSTTTGWPVQMAVSGAMFANILNLDGDNMYVITTNEGSGMGCTEMRGYLYNGTSWGSGFLINQTRQYGGANIAGGGRAWSASTWGSSIYLTYQTKEFDGGELWFREYATGAWGDTVILASGFKDRGEPSLAVNGANRDLYVFWYDWNPSYYHHIRYITRRGGSWDADPTDWIDESFHQFISDAGVSGDDLSQHIMTYPEVYSGRIAVYYTTAKPDGVYSIPLEWPRSDLRMALLEVEAGPAVRTEDAIDIGNTGMTLQGTLVNDGGESCSVRFQYGLTTAYGTNTAWQSGKGTGDVFSQAISGLSPGTTYHFRAQAKWADGTTTNADGRYAATTSAGNPTVTTGNAVDVTAAAATLQGTITSMGDYGTVYVSFQYGLTSGYGTTTAEQTRTAAGGFNQAITGLTAETTYHFRAALRYGTSYIYGSDNTFVTLAAPPPTLSPPGNFRVTGHTDTSLSLAWTRASGATNTVVRSSTTAYPTSPTSGTAVYSGTGSSVTHTGLTTDTVYYYSAWSESGGSYSGTYATATGTPSTDTTPVPDTLRIDDVKVYTGYFDDGDQLYVINYRIIYDAGDPGWDCSDYFDFVLLDGAIVRAKTPVKSWGYRPGSIYLKVESAPTWGGLYTVRIAGNPAKWGTPPTANYDLSPGDWQGADLTLLDSWVMSLAHSIEAMYSVQLVTYDDIHGVTHLTGQGVAVFGLGIPGLCQVRPHLCNPYAIVDPGPREPGEVLVIDPSARVGPEIHAATTSVAAFFNLDDPNVPAAVGFGIAFVALGLLLTVMLGRWGAMGGLAGFGIASPILIAGAWTGYLPWAVIIVPAAIIASIVLLVVWVKGV